MIRSAVKLFASTCLAAAMAGACWATDPPAAEAPATPAASTAPSAADIAKLKAQVEDQQKQLDKLKAALDAQLKALEQAGLAKQAAPADAAAASTDAAAAPTAAPGSAPKPYVGSLTASTTPIIQPDPSPAARNPFPATPSPRIPMSLDSPSPQPGPPESPLQLKIGETTITPVGFMDMTAVFRSTATNFGIGTNFGSFPFNNSFPLARLTETRFSLQNSRIGARFDTKVHGANVTGYWESDFLGGSASNNLSVTSNSFVFRMRLYWVDVRKDKWEFLAGQSWSLLTPGRNGISPIPGDVFYTQDMDTNYNVGLTWGRIPGFRFVYHPSNTVALGFSAENSDQYIGGSGGGGATVLPSGLASTFVNQLDNAASSFQTPNVMPDIIGKLAFDPKTGPLHQHIELYGVVREFKTFNQNNNNHYTATGGAGGINMNFEIAKGLHPIINSFYGSGGGRYMFGTIPDIAIRPDGSISTIKSIANLDGFEYQAKNTLLFGYFGIYYGGKDSIIDTNGKFVGYGYPGSANSQNRVIQEPSIGINQTFWKDPKWGALSLIFQYSWLNRDPWAVLSGQPKNAHQSQVWLDIRYTLPGSAPSWR